ncbi:MAG TPA: helix-turn-helix domain-containing protein [Candidatus Nanoarchaeia archaeon]|nr:helix-turn-helix domain-containing protein [Candidatus Nanoarchaeia archaeon]
MTITPEEQRQTAHIILRTAERIKTGKDKLALFLKGSQSKLMKDDELNRLEGYGALLWHDISIIRTFIVQLEEMEFLSVYFVNTGDYRYQILRLTPAGHKALNENIAIPLNIRDEPVIMNESERETLELIHQECSIEQIMEQRGLARSTVWDHVAKLVKMGEISAREFVAQDKIDRIVQTVMRLHDARLKNVKKELPDISYDEIKTVTADKRLIDL